MDTSSPAPLGTTPSLRGDRPGAASRFGVDVLASNAVTTNVHHADPLLADLNETVCHSTGNVLYIQFRFRLDIETN